MNEDYINKVRRDIAHEALNFVIKRSNTYALVIKTFTGSGKTTTVLNAIDKAGMRWIYVAPFHKVIRQNVKRSPIRHFKFLHLEGRERSCLRNELKPLIRKGVSISGFCNDCNFKTTACPYYQNRKRAYSEMPNLAITHAHIQTFLPRFLNTIVEDHLIRDHYDIMIIDENPISCFLHQKQLSRRELRYIHEVFTLCGMNSALIQFIDMLLRSDIPYDEIYRLNLNELNATRVNSDFSNRVAELYNNGVISDIPDNIIPIIFEIASRMEENNLEDMIYYREDTLNLVYFTADSLNLGIRIIGLDGTANRSVWEAMLGTDNFDEFSVDHTYKNVYQLVGGLYTIWTWKLNESVQKRLCALIDKIAARKKRKVLVLGTKWSNRTVASLCKSENLMYANFYNLRSFNDFYKECDTLVLPIEPNPPKESLESYISLSDWDKKLWRKIVRDEEMLQGIGRIRQNIEYIEQLKIQRENIEIFIFPSTGMKRIHASDIQCPSSTDPLTKIDDNLCRYVPTLLKEATPITMKQLDMYLDGKIDLNDSNTIISDILHLCPTNMKEIQDKLGYTRTKTRKYLRYMQKRRLIKKGSANTYDITKRGYRKLTPEKKEKRTQRL